VSAPVGHGPAVGPGQVATTLAALALAVTLLAPGTLAPLLARLAPQGAPALYDRADMATLALAHLGLVATALALSALVAIGLAILVSREAGADLLPLSRGLVGIGQTLPPVAVLALAVPALGFGTGPTLVALFLYGLLPIFESASAGLASVPAPVKEAARGMGMGPWRRLAEVELPLALPLIVAGLRVAAVIGVGTATIGSTVAAKGLGEVILAGLATGNPAFVLQGAIVVALLAALVDRALAAAERALGPGRRRGRRRAGVGAGR
jgi:osmoprotectant transport system permease protein